MNRGTIPLSSLSGGCDLYTTLESGQSYTWWRSDGNAYAGWNENPPYGCWYYTVLDGEVLRVREREDVLEWESTGDGEALARKHLRLTDDLPALYDHIPDDPLIRASIDYAPGLRLIRDPPFRSLIAFICSTQMRVSRIHDMVTALVETYGKPREVDGEVYHSFPRPETLAKATESELRDIGLGYRAPYVRDTARLVAEEGLDPAAAREMAYPAAREYLTEFVGAGQKVADCVALFACDHLEAVPLDTWIKQAIATWYPACDSEGYEDCSRAIRDVFGGDDAGYVQTYVFHYLRTRNGPVDAPVAGHTPAETPGD